MLKLPGRSPKKRVAKMITNDLQRKSRPFMIAASQDNELTDVESGSSTTPLPPEPQIEIQKTETISKKKCYIAVSRGPQPHEK